MPVGDTARTRIRDYFLSHVREIVTKEQLQEVARISDWARRVRELRDEEGWPILSYKNLLNAEDMQRFGINRQLRPGEYILAGLEKADVTAIQISKDVRQTVLQRYGATCQLCGRGPSDTDPYNPTRRIILHVDHIFSLKDGGTNDLDNLWPICSVCNEGKKDRSLIRRDVLELLEAINIQPPDVQKMIYERLKERWG